jgi:hypothetical protein
VDHTLYVFGQYFGWREIIRQEIQFLDLGDVPETKDLAELLEGITHSLSSSAPSLPTNLKLFRGEQRAIGERMMLLPVGTESASMGHRCVGYAGFVEALGRPDFDAWFAKLRSFVVDLESGGSFDFGRLSLLHNALIDLIDTLDPDCVRFPRHLRNRMAMSAGVASLRPRDRGDR